MDARAWERTAWTGELGSWRPGPGVGGVVAEQASGQCGRESLGVGGVDGEAEERAVWKGSGRRERGAGGVNAERTAWARRRAVWTGNSGAGCMD